MSSTSSRSARTDAATIAIVTFVVLVFELTLTRLYAYIGSTHATATALSVALLGLGLGAFGCVRWPRAVPHAALALVVALLAVAIATLAGAPLVVHVGVALGPFSCAGMLVAAAYAARGSVRARSTYAIDLGAAALGCLVAPRLLGPLSPTEIASGLAALCCVLVPRRLALIALAPASLLVLGRLERLPDGSLAALLRAELPEKAMTATGEIVDSAWSPVGRVDVQRSADADALGVYTDGMSPTYLVREAAAREVTFEATWGLLMSLPYRALHPDRVLVLGAGAGASVWLAKHYGASRVDAVEVSPAIPGVLARWRAFGGDVYHEPGVRLFIEDARRYLLDTAERYDTIELALALTGNVHAQPAGLEAHLYTVEAVELYLRRLAPTGALVLIHSDPGNAYRQLRTVLDALERVGVARSRALDGIVVLHDPRPEIAYRYLLVVRTSPLSLEAIDELDVDPAELLWAPGDPPERAAQLLDPAQLGATGRDDLAPVHDERPYFFQNTRGLLATALAESGRLWVLGGALLLIAILVVERGREARALLRPAAVATGLGAAFICVELALIQRFTLAAGGTLYAVSFVLFALLAWCAIGSLVFGAWWRRLDRGLALATLVAGIAIAATAWVARDLGWLDHIADPLLRRLAIALLLAPAGIAIGCPFPTLLAGSDQIASLWAINGAASVAGGAIAVLALRVGGSTHALVVGAALYFATATIAPTLRASAACSR